MSSVAVTTDSVPGLVETLRQCRLLSPAQLETVQGELRLRYDDPRALAGALLERGWLTAYQINQLFQGRGAELILDSYVILDRLGEGAAGQVFKARHQHMQRTVALKVIRKELLSDAEVLQRFYREIQVTSQISHANVVHAYDAGPIGANHMLVMEYVEGIDLQRRVSESGPLPAGLACDYARQAALGLQHIHECGLVHRDIKPSNLLVTPEGQVKILDLGLARLQPSNARQGGQALTQLGAGMMGTPDYLAPEQAINLSKVDIRADIYSLGCTCFFLLTGQPPFPGGTLAQKLMRHQQAPVPSVRQQRPKLPKDLDRILGRMLAKKPEDRYPTPEAVARDLATLARSHRALGLPQNSRKGTAVGPGRSPGKGRRWLSGWRKVRLIGVVLLLLGIVTAAMLLLPGRQTESSPVAEQGGPKPTPSRPVFEPPPPTKSGPAKELIAVLGDGRGRHWGPVVCVAFSRDSKYVVSGGTDHVVRIWDAATRVEQLVLGDDLTMVGLLALSPDGRTLVAHTRETAERAPELRVWNASTAKPVRTVPLNKGESVSAMHFSPDGQTLFALARRPGMALIRYWDVLAGVEKKGPTTVTGNFNQACLSADGKMVALATGNQCIIAAGDNFQKHTTFAPGVGAVTGLDFAPNGQALAVVVSKGLTQEIKLWDPATGKEKLALAPDLNSLNAVTWSADSQLLAVAGQRNVANRLEPEVQTFDASNGQKRATFAGHTLPVTELAFAPDGKSLATCSQDHSVRVWEVATGKERAPNEAGHRTAVNFAAFRPDDRSLVSMGASGDPTVKSWDAATGREHSTLNLAIGGRFLTPTQAVMANDLQHLVTWSAQGVKYWDIGTGRERDVFTSAANEVRGATISPDGKLVVMALAKGVRLWDAGTGQEQPLPVQVLQVSNLAFSPDGKTLAIGEVRAQAPRGEVHLWDVTAGRERAAPLTMPHPVQALAFAGDGQTLVISTSGIEAGKLVSETRLWNVADGKARATLPGPLQTRPPLLAAPQGPALATWDAKTLRVFDMTTGNERFNVAGNWTAGRGVAFSRDGQKVAAAGSDGRVLVWSATSGGKLYEGKAPGAILHVSFANDGKHLVTGNANGTISILRLP